MRQILLGHQSLAMREASKSLLDDCAVLIAIHYACVRSAEELSLLQRAKEGALFDNVPRKVRQALNSMTNAPETTGRYYACSGQVIATGKHVRSLRTGDFVACVDVDLEHYADIICVPEEKTVRISSMEHLRSAILVGAGQVAFQAVRQANVRLGESVAIIGITLVSRIIIQLLRLSGCKIIVFDTQGCAARIPDMVQGDELICGSLNDAAEREISLATEGHGIDALITLGSCTTEDMSKQLIRMMRSKGSIVIVDQTDSVNIPTAAYEKDITFSIYNSYAEENSLQHDIQEERRKSDQNARRMFCQLLEKGRIDTSALLGSDRELNVTDSNNEAPEQMMHKAYVIRYQQHDASFLDRETPTTKQKSNHKKVSFFTQKSNLLRVGVVGVGRFAKTKLLPILSHIKGLEITAVVDATITNALNVASLYGIENVLLDDEQLFASDVDAVIIASPHKFHCDQALRALEKGKAVFLEKPMVTDFAQLDKLMTFLEEHKDAPFCVDYSRSFSPFMYKIKHELVGRKTPIIVHYRVNAGFMPKEHWMQTNVGAGRIIGDACHIIDLFCYLVESRPLSVSVESLHANADNLFPTDNFSVQISFEDGSLCSLIYTALGHENVGRERMELFFDAKTIIMDDYEYLAGFGLPKFFDETVTVPDKGHEALLTLFCTSLMHKEFRMPIPLERLKQVAYLTLMIDRLACEGGGTAAIHAAGPIIQPTIASYDMY